MTEAILGFERHLHPELERIRQLYFWIHLLADFGCGACFVFGSAFFFYPSLLNSATWMFLIGSILFAVKPTVRLGHELHRRKIRRRLEALAQGGGA
jgi:hypothetical protein